MARKRRLSPAAKRAANAAAARAILERRGAAAQLDVAPAMDALGLPLGWTSAVDLVRAGVMNPRQAIADLRHQGVEIDERATAGRFVEWRLREQLADQRDAEVAREQE